MPDWSIPTDCYGITRPRIRRMVESQVSTYESGCIFLLIGQDAAQLEIGDLRHDSIHLEPIYALAITQEWVQDLNQPGGICMCQTLIDTATIWECMCLSMVDIWYRRYISRFL